MNAVSARTIHIATFEHSGDNVVKAQELSVEDFIRLLTGEPELVANNASKDAGEAWSPVKYRPGATRSAAGVEALSAIAFDFDKGRDGQAGLTEDDCNDLFDWLADTRWLFASHNSFTSGDYHPREKLRIVLFFDRDVTPEEYKRIWPALAAQMPVPPDPSCKNVDRFYYSPRIPAKHRAVYQADTGGTEFVQVDKILKKPTLGISLNNVKEAEFKSEEDLLKELETTKSKQETLNRVSFTLGKRLGEVGGTLNAAALDQGWAKCRAALERNKASEPVKDWAKAEAWCTRGMRQGHEVGGAARTQELAEQTAVAETLETFQPTDAQMSRAVATLKRQVKLVEADPKQVGQAAYTLGRFTPHVLSAEHVRNELFKAATQLEDSRKNGINGGEADLAIAGGIAKGQKNRHYIYTGWKSRLTVDSEKGTIIACDENAGLFFEHHPDTQGLLKLNVRKGKGCLQYPPPWPTQEASFPRPIEDADGLDAGAWLATQMGRPLSSYERSVKVMLAVASKFKYDPFKEWLVTQEWDGTPRLESWLASACKVEDSPYHRLVGARWLLSAVARTFKPGCQAQHALVFYGPQGIGKSAAFRALAGEEYFCSNIGELGSKDSLFNLEKYLIVEFAELAGFRKTDIETIKRLMTDTEEDLRQSYGVTSRVVVRRAIFSGTSNEKHFLVDETGNRRFWPVTCEGFIDLDWIADQRSQLWSEALKWYQDGRPWWPVTGEERALCDGVQWDHFDEDQLMEKLKAFEAPCVTAQHLDVRPEQLGEGSLFRWVTIPQIHHFLDTRIQERSDQLKVKRMLKRIGWVESSTRIDGIKMKIWKIRG